MEFEDRLVELFDSATATLRPPVEELLEGGSARGRRLRRRRRGAKAALGTLGVTAVVCGTAIGVQYDYSPSPARSAVAAVGTGSAGPTGPAAPTSTVTPPTFNGPFIPAKASATPSATTHQASTTVPAQTSSPGPGGTPYDLLKSLLPTGADLKPMPYDWGGTVPGAADAVYDDGHGAVALSVSTTSSQVLSSCADWLGGSNEGERPAGATPVSCTSATLPDGDIQTTVVTGVDENGFYDYEVTLVRTDGTNVMASVGNGIPEGASVDVTRLVPPLTIAQLQAIAADPGWRLSGSGGTPGS